MLIDRCTLVAVELAFEEVMVGKVSGMMRERYCCTSDAHCEGWSGGELTGL